MIKLCHFITAPYGIREPTERIGSDKPRRSSNSEAAMRFPTKTVYTFHEILFDLLCFSALHLKLSGRLVTWIPVFRYTI